MSGEERENGEVIHGYFPEPKVVHDSRCPNPCPDLDLTSEHGIHCTEWPEPEHCSRCRRYTRAALPDEDPAPTDSAPTDPTRRTP